jgi:hypothetical protein
MSLAAERASEIVFFVDTRGLDPVAEPRLAAEEAAGTGQLVTTGGATPLSNGSTVIDAAFGLRTVVVIATFRGRVAVVAPRTQFAVGPRREINLYAFRCARIAHEAVLAVHVGAGLLTEVTANID